MLCVGGGGLFLWVCLYVCVGVSVYACVRLFDVCV